MQIVFLIGIIS